MSERARALEQAREWQAIAYGDRPETWAALDYYRELGWPVDSNKFPERERVEGRIFAFMSGYREALKAAVDHPPPSGASSQAETVAKLLLAARQVASFARAWEPLSPGDIRDLTKAIEAMDALPAPVSPVEPTPEPPVGSEAWRQGSSVRPIMTASSNTPPEPETCKWRCSADAEWWESGCDSQDLSGDERLVGPDEKAKFCPYCGKPLRLVEETPR